jgi:hypothetical protein
MAFRGGLVGSVLVCAALALAVGAQTASAASRPTAFTGEATEVAYTSATLRGVVNPGNQPTSYYVQYGTSAAYGAQTPVTLAGAGTQSIHVAVALSGLSAGSAYNYRLVAVNPSGTVYGAGRVFSTKKIPLTFSFTTTPSRDPYGSPFTVIGNLSGTGSANHAVQLQANPFPFLSGFRPLGDPELTDASGRFSFVVPGLPQNTQLRVATVDRPGANSAVVVELVAVRVTFRLRPTSRRGFVRFFGTVTPGVVGSLVGFQLIRPGRAPRTVGGTVVRRANASVSRFSAIVRIRRAGLYRAFVRVLSGAQVSNHSRTILIR